MKIPAISLTVGLLLLTGCISVQAPPTAQSPVPASSPTASGNVTPDKTTPDRTTTDRTTTDRTTTDRTATEPEAKSASDRAEPKSQSAATTGATPTDLDPSCAYRAGEAVDGQTVTLDLCSVKGDRSDRSEMIFFSYYLNQERIDAKAACANQTWITYPDKQENRPQSAATQAMIEKVCITEANSTRAASSGSNATVFDPPSNVRVVPNGEILCTIRESRTIQTYGISGSWYKTDACGKVGFIHADQLRF
jgi:serine/threonine protein kinase, bacterial